MVGLPYSIQVVNVVGGVPLWCDFYTICQPVSHAGDRSAFLALFLTSYVVCDLSVSSGASGASDLHRVKMCQISMM